MLVRRERQVSHITIADQGDYLSRRRGVQRERIGKLPADKQDDAWKEFFTTHRTM